MAQQVFKNSIDIGNSINANASTQPKRTLRDLDDFQSYLLPDITPQEYVDALKGGKKYKEIIPNHEKIDTALVENMDDAVMGEMNMSPREYNDLLKKTEAPRQIFEDAMNKWDEWNKSGRPKTDEGDWNHDYFSNYKPEGYLRWYRPREQWGAANKIHAQEEWNDFDFNGLHKEFDPFKSGYETARKSWNEFLTGPWGAYANPKFNKILEWLDKNKENF